MVERSFIVQDYYDPREIHRHDLINKLFLVKRAKTNIMISVLNNVKVQCNEPLHYPSVKYEIPLVDGVLQFYLSHLTTDGQARCLLSYQQPDTPGFLATLSSPSRVLRKSPREHLEHTFEVQILRFGSLVKYCC